MPRFLTLLLVTLLCTCVRAQTTRVDTVRGPMAGTTAYHYVTEMPASAKMTKAELFSRGLKPSDVTEEPWERLDSIKIVDTATGRKLSGFSLNQILEGNSGNPRSKPPARYSREQLGSPDEAPVGVYYEADLIVLEGRIGSIVRHSLTIKNDAPWPQALIRKDGSTDLKTIGEVFNIPSGKMVELPVETRLPPGAVTYPMILGQGDSVRLEARFSLNGYDLNEADFVAEGGDIPTWQVPLDREVMYLRLRSTEKLMTVYANGEVYNKVAVGRQLDELSLVGLAAGDYLLEVIDLGSGQKRYHRLRR